MSSWDRRLERGVGAARWARFAAEELDDSQDDERDNAESDDPERRRMPKDQHDERHRSRDDPQRAFRRTTN